MNIQERPEWQQRVFQEKEELDEWLRKLADFLEDDSKFESLTVEDQNLLIKQQQLMLDLSGVLGHHIARFGK